MQTLILIQRAVSSLSLYEELQLSMCSEIGVTLSFHWPSDVEGTIQLWESWSSSCESRLTTHLTELPWVLDCFKLYFPWQQNDQVIPYIVRSLWQLKIIMYPKYLAHRRQFINGRFFLTFAYLKFYIKYKHTLAFQETSFAVKHSHSVQLEWKRVCMKEKKTILTRTKC